MPLKRYTPETGEEVEAILNTPLTKKEELDLNDPKYDWVEVGSYVEHGYCFESSSKTKSENAKYGFPKYGRSVYCLNTKIRRGSTMSEFYRGSSVD